MLNEPGAGFNSTFVAVVGTRQAKAPRLVGEAPERGNMRLNKEVKDVGTFSAAAV